MISILLGLAEIAHELEQMDKGETFSLYCDVNASRCCDLKIDTWGVALGQKAPKTTPDLLKLGWAIRDLAERLEFHFVRRVSARAGKGL